MSRNKSKTLKTTVPQTLPAIDAQNADTIPTISVGLRPDGKLCVILPGLNGHSRSPIVSDKGAGLALRQILEAMASRRNPGIGTMSEPTSDALRHADHLEAKTYEPRCPHCQYEMAANGMDNAPVKIRRVEVKKIARNGDVDIQRRTDIYYCACGFHGSFKQLGEHLALHWPKWPSMPPKEFPHHEVRPSAILTQRRIEQEREEYNRRIDSGEIGEIEL